MQFSIMMLIVITSSVQAQDLLVTECRLVPCSFCHSNGTFITDGSASPADQRMVWEHFEICKCPGERYKSQPCENNMQICCRLPQEIQTSPELTTLADKWETCGKGFDVAHAADHGNKSLTSKTEFPWMAMVANSKDNTMLCGASILHHHVVMTAAHCLGSFQAPDLIVRAGVWQRQDLKEAQNASVKRIIKHEKFGPRNFTNDIALLVLQDGLQLSQNVAPICLPIPNIDIEGRECVATGWGTPKYGERILTDFLMKVNLETMFQPTCENDLRTVLGPWFLLHESFVCAKGENGADTCIGDGGGPLMLKHAGKYFQVGIVSAGVKCYNGLPALYANVKHLMPWIEENFSKWNLKNIQ